MWICKIQMMWKCKIQKDVKYKETNAAFENQKKIIVIILNTNEPIKHFVVLDSLCTHVSIREGGEIWPY